MDYNKLYSKEDDYWMEGPQDMVLEAMKCFPEKGRVLDLGCGEGQNALYLASKGYDVVAVDIAEEGIKKLLRRAEENGLSIEGHVGDVKDFVGNGDKYDVILCMNIFFIYRREIYL